MAGDQRAAVSLPGHRKPMTDPAPALSHELFLLMLNLSQLSDADEISSCFVEAINSRRLGVVLAFSGETDAPGSDDACNQTVPVTSHGRRFGTIHCEPDLNVLDGPTGSLVRNAIGMLAILLENRRQEQMLTDSLREQTSRLRRSQRRARLAMEATRDAFWEWHIDSDEVFLSDRYYTMLGFAPGTLEATISSLPQRIHPEDREQIEQTVQDIRDGLKGSFEMELRQETADGGWLWTLVRGRSLPPTTGSGGPICAGTISDISARKKAEEERRALEAQLRQAQKMEAVGRLAGGVAHDFNNKLQVIQGNLDLLLDETPEGHPFEELLHEIRHATGRSSDLTRQLLAFARKQTIVPQMLDLNETIAGMLRMLSRLIGENVELSWQPGPKSIVRMDPTQMDQILANLVVNARDAIADVGKITISTQRRELSAERCSDPPMIEPGRYAMLSVADDGMGMDRDTLGQIFEPFFTTKPADQGTGLGLATVYGIVKQNDGFVEVDSQPGKGTVFRIFVPLQQSAKDEMEYHPTPRYRTEGTETILLVEDDPSILRLSREILHRMGYTVLTAEGSQTALDTARGHDGPIDLLITDVVMPRMNGHELARKLLAERPTTRCLFMSGYTADTIVRPVDSDHEVYFLQKPFSAEDLATQVRQALRQNAAS